MSGCGHEMSVGGHVMSGCGHEMSVCGHVMSVGGHVMSVYGHVMSVYGHVMSVCDHVTWSVCTHYSLILESLAWIAAASNQTSEPWNKYNAIDRNLSKLYILQTKTTKW